MCVLRSRAAFGAALLSLLVAACSGDQGPTTRPATVRTVTLATSRTVPLPRELPVTGALRALDQAELGFRVAGTLLQIACDVGDRVEAGQLLASLDPRDFELEVARSEAAIAQTRARLGIQGDGDEHVDPDTTATVREAQAVLVEARMARDRARELVQANLTPQSELDAAEATFSVAESRVQRARQEVNTWLAELQQRRIEQQLAQKRMQDASLRAPFAGVVADRATSRGQVLAAGTRVLTLLCIEPLRLRLQVPERQAALVHIGQAVRFTVDGVDGEHRGTVARILPDIDRASRVLSIEAEVRNEGGVLRPGGFCRASIVVDPGAEAVAVPAAAVLSFAGVDRVFVPGRNKEGAAIADEILVELGPQVDGWIVILRGVDAGRQVVADATGLTPRAPIQVAD